MCRWEELGRRGWDASFDAVLCVGNSLTHAAGETGRRAALAAMAGVLRPGGSLAVTSRNWELVRAAGPGLQVAERLVERDGRRGLVIHAWTLGATWQDEHLLDVAVALLDGDRVTTHAERLAFWPFTHEALDGDLRAAGLEPVASTYAPDVERYLVKSRREPVRQDGNPMEDVEIRGDMIRLGQLLKLTGLAGSGTDAKALIAAGEVRVNEEVELRRGRQLHHGDVVTVGARSVRLR